MRPALILLVAAGAVWAQGSSGRGDSEVVEFILPGQFDKAKAKAKKENRLILIKGVGFGVDKTGASCATKGKW